MDRGFLILLAVLGVAVGGCWGTIECVPDCAGRQCGGDGCRGSCGACAIGLTCNEQAGACQSPTLQIVRLRLCQ